MLRRLVDDPGALRKAARTALEIMHFDPDTGEEDNAALPDRERCVRACYDCLLSYANQSLHEMIDRHLVRDLMLRLAAAEVEHASVQDKKSDHPERTVPTLPAQPGSPEGEFAAWLRAAGLREPDAVGEEVFGVCPDLIYRLPDSNVAVFFADADHESHDVLRDEGWSVILIGPEDDWQQVAGRYPSVFGSQQEGTP